MEQGGDCTIGGVNESTNEGAGEASLLVSSSVGAWDILIGLMSSLRGVAKLYLEQGIVKEARHYAREGATVARGLLLTGWWVTTCMWSIFMSLTLSPLSLPLFLPPSPSPFSSFPPSSHLTPSLPLYQQVH